VPSPEHRLLLACARHTLAPGPSADASLLRAVDAGRLLALARRHGMLPLLARWLRAAGAEGAGLAAALRPAAVEGARGALALTAALIEVSARLQAEGIPVAAYKGPALAVQTYGDPALRSYGDLDLVVPPGLEPSVRVLRGMGFAPQGFASARERAAVLRDGHHLELARGTVIVELHWRFSKRTFGFREDLADACRRRGTVTVAGAAVPVLAPQDHLLGLAIHASKEAWSALEGTLSIALLAGALPDRAWPDVADRARAWGCVRALQVSLLLAEELLAAPFPAQLAALLPPGAATRALARRIAARTLSAARTPADYFAIQLALRAGPVAKTRFLLRSAFVATPDDWAAARGRRGGLALGLGRPFRLFGRYLGGARHAPGGG
jgi:hypothetical protein